MTEETPLDRARENVSGIVSLLVTGLWMTALFVGVEYWWLVLIVGYAVVLPLTGILFDDEAPEETRISVEDHAVRGERDRSRPTPNGPASDETPLESLRRRYAEGELTDEQFKRKLDRLLETETLEDVAEYRERANADRERELERE